jgi:hypothetical protein
MSFAKVKGSAKNETMQDKIAKAREKKEAAKERKEQARSKAEKPQPETSQKVQRNAPDKKMANFLNQAKNNREKQTASKKLQLERMQAKLVALKEAKDSDSDDDMDEGDEGDEIPEGDEGDELPEDEKEQEALKEFEEQQNKAELKDVSAKEGETLDSDSDLEGEKLTEVESMEDLKKKFTGKRVLTVEELKTEAAREVRLEEIVKRRGEQQKEFVAERQSKQALRRQSKRRKLQGNQRSRIGPSYMPFLSKGF